jgi:MFS family permease
VDNVLAAGPVREFRWYRGRRFYSGWYWSATTGGLATSFLAKRFGTVRVYAVSLAAFTIASVLCALAGSVPQLVAARWCRARPAPHSYPCR